MRKVGRIPDGGGWRAYGKNSPEARAAARAKTRGARAWETFLQPPISKASSAKIWPSYLGGAGLYAVAFAASAAVLVAGGFKPQEWASVTADLVQGKIGRAVWAFVTELYGGHHLLSASSFTFILLCLVLCFIPRLQVLAVRNQAIAFPDADWPTTLSAARSMRSKVVAAVLLVVLAVAAVAVLVGNHLF